jgi:Bacterial Ig-like domain (group 3)
MQGRFSLLPLLLACVLIGSTATARAAATTVTITPSANPAQIGQSETITFTVTNNGGPPLTGTLAYGIGGFTRLVSVNGTNGIIVLRRVSQSGPPRTETYRARYQDDPNNSPSPVATLSLVIVEAGGPASKIAFGSSANPTFIGQVTTYTAAVLGSITFPPTGTVSFNFGDGSAVAVQPLATTGVATAIHAYTTAGSYAVTATYSGDSNNPAVTAPTVGQVVSDSGSSSALTFVPMSPCRLLDTRNAAGPFGAPAIANGATRSFAVPQGACNIPAAAAAYSVNVTVVPLGPLNYLTVWPTGAPQPAVSLLNSNDGRIKANAAIVPAGTGGAISMFVNGSAATDVIVDINGYFIPSAPTGLAFFPLTPCRVVDTRTPAAPLAGPSLSAGQTRDFPVQSGRCHIPASAQAYSFSAIGISPAGTGYLQFWPTGQAQPTTSTLTLRPGMPIANAAIVQAGAGGSISAYASSNTDVVIDVNGYFGPAAVGGVYLHTVPPCRAIDTRNNYFPPFPGTYTVSIQGGPCAPPDSATAYVLNATVVPLAPVQFLTLWPSIRAQPEASTLNATDGVTTSNMAIVPTENGAIDAYSPDSTHLLLDLSGYFAP